MAYGATPVQVCSVSCVMQRKVSKKDEGVKLTYTYLLGAMAPWPRRAVAACQTVMVCDHMTQSLLSVAGNGCQMFCSIQRKHVSPLHTYMCNPLCFMWGTQAAFVCKVSQGKTRASLEQGRQDCITCVAHTSAALSWIVFGVSSTECTRARCFICESLNESIRAEISRVRAKGGETDSVSMGVRSVRMC